MISRIIHVAALSLILCVTNASSAAGNDLKGSQRSRQMRKQLRVPDRPLGGPPIQAPVSVPVCPPVRAPVARPMQPPVKAPANSPVKSPVKSPQKSPVRPPVKHPVKPPTKAPTRHPTQVPTETPSQAPVPGGGGEGAAVAFDVCIDEAIETMDNVVCPTQYDVSIDCSFDITICDVGKKCSSTLPDAHMCIIGPPPAQKVCRSGSFDPNIPFDGCSAVECIDRTGCPTGQFCTDACGPV